VGNACQLEPDVDDDPGRDHDGDRVLDIGDNCPRTANVSQSDRDGDGFGDACDPDRDGDGLPEYRGGLFDFDLDRRAHPMGDFDLCPAHPSADNRDFDGDFFGDPCDDDMDGDGVLDTLDNCPRFANRVPPMDRYQLDQDGDGIGDACDVDRDGDKQRNDIDACPDLFDPGHVGDGPCVRYAGPALTGGATGRCIRMRPARDAPDTDNDGLPDICDDDDDGDGRRVARSRALRSHR